MRKCQVEVDGAIDLQQHLRNQVGHDFIAVSVVGYPTG